MRRWSIRSGPPAALAAAAAADGLADALAALPCLGLSKAVLAPLAAAGVRDLRAAAAPNENALFALLKGVPIAV